MKISTKGRYALRLMIYIAEKDEGSVTTLREVSVITNYHSPERRLLEQQAEDPAKQDSILAEQEKRKAAELKELEQRKAAEQRAVDKEIQEELEKQFIQAQGAQTVQDTEKADTVR